MSETDYIRVNWVVMGADRGVKRIHKGSIVGALASGNWAEALRALTPLAAELEGIAFIYRYGYKNYYLGSPAPIGLNWRWRSASSSSAHRA